MAESALCVCVCVWKYKYIIKVKRKIEGKKICLQSPFWMAGWRLYMIANLPACLFNCETGTGGFDSEHQKLAWDDHLPRGDYVNHRSDHHSRSNHYAKRWWTSSKWSFNFIFHLIKLQLHISNYYDLKLTADIETCIYVYCHRNPIKNLKIDCKHLEIPNGSICYRVNNYSRATKM